MISDVEPYSLWKAGNERLKGGFPKGMLRRQRQRKRLRRRNEWRKGALSPRNKGLFSSGAQAIKGCFRTLRNKARFAFRRGRHRPFFSLTNMLPRAAGRIPRHDRDSRLRSGEHARSDRDQGVPVDSSNFAEGDTPFLQDGYEYSFPRPAATRYRLSSEVQSSRPLRLLSVEFLSRTGLQSVVFQLVCEN